MMKNFFVTLFFLFTPVLLHAQVLITEIMYDLPGADAGREWIEVYNGGPVYNFSSWKFVEGGVRHGITYVQGGALNSGDLYTNEYAVIADDVDQFKLDNPSYQGKLYSSSFSLSNTGEILRIEDSGAVNYGEVTYSSSWGGAGDGQSLQVSGSDWVAGSSTPGYVYAGSEPEPFVIPIKVSGVIDSDTVWSSEQGTYLINGEVTVSASSTLTIMPGTVVKFMIGGAGSLKIFGRLNAIGTDDENIVFTSLLDDSVGGRTNYTDVSVVTRDWQGISFETGSSGILEYVQVKYGGYTGYGIRNNGGVVNTAYAVLENNYGAGVLVNGGEFNISNSVINNSSRGIEVLQGVVDVDSNIISNNSFYGVYSNGGNIALNLRNNSFINNAKTAYIEASADFSHNNNTSSDVLNRGFEMSGHVRNGSVWHTDDLPIINIGGITIPENSTLTIAPNTVIKMNPSALIQVSGVLNMMGEKDKEIQITSYKDDTIFGDTNMDGGDSIPNIGDWSFILFLNGSNGNLNFVKIKYAGALAYPFIRAGLINLGGDVSISNSTFLGNYDSDVYQDGGSLEITSSAFSANSIKGIIMENGSVFITKTKFDPYMTAVENRSASSTVEAVGNWWGTESGPRIQDGAPGPGAYALGLVNVDPWIRRDPSLPNPVIIVPGMTGSRIVNTSLILNNEVWPNIFNLAFPGQDSFLEKLSLQPSGLSDPNSTLKATEVIKSINIPLFNREIFSGLGNEFNSLGYIEGQEIFFFPYDWRLDIATSASDLSDYLNEIILSTGAEKVNVVAHSMGGLVVKKYLLQNNDDLIARFIDVATPHYGAPKAHNTLFFGDIDIKIANKDTMKIISQNMPAVYQLLPSRSYFNESESDYRYYVFDGVSGTGRLTFDQTKGYMKSAGRNAALVDRADVFHQEIDGLNPLDYEVETYNIVGCGVPTIGQFFILSKKGDQYKYNIKMINGDGTVPLKSAEAMRADKTFYVKNVQHAVMPSASGVTELVVSLLTDESLDRVSYPNILDTADQCQLPDGVMVSMHSPINLHIYDNLGNHSGPNENGDIENNISGVQYEVVEGNKFAFLPSGFDYQIKGVSTGTGEFDIFIQDIKNGEVTQTSVFSGIPLTASTKTNFDIGANVPNQVYVDMDGDDNYEQIYSVSTTSQGLIDTYYKETQQEVVQEEVAETRITGRSGGAKKVELIQAAIEPKAVLAEHLSPANLPTTRREIINPQSNISRVDENISTTTSERLNYNLASAHQSFSQKLTGFFKSIWSWFTSKL